MYYTELLAANKMNEYLDIEDREKDYKEIHSETFRTETGIRAIGLYPYGVECIY